MSTAYHPQTDGRTKRVNQGLETYLRCVSFLHPKSWHKWLSLAQWWYNSNHHTYLKMSPFEALFGYKLPILPAMGNYSTVATLEEYLQQRRVLQQLKRELASAQNKMKKFSDYRRSERNFVVGEEVYLQLRYPHLKSISRGQVSKLSPKYYGPFSIIAKIGQVAYRLQLPENSHIHPVFHVSLLKKLVGAQRVSPSLPTLPREIHETLEPEAIVNRRVIYKQGAPLIQVLVKWQDKTTEDNTWEYLLDLLKQFPRSANLLSNLEDKNF